MHRVKIISPWQFVCFRILFGTYLAIHFLHLLPYAGELFSGEGMLGEPRLNFTYGLLPNPLEHCHAPAAAVLFVAALALLAVAFAFGVVRRTVSLLLWFGWACLFNRNNLILNPGIPYVGLLLLLCALIPRGEPLSLLGRKAGPSWHMPAMIYWVAWFLLAAGYTYSGCYKLLSPSWTDGSALFHLANNPLARPGLSRELLLALPEGALKLLTWAALAGEVLALPLSLHRRGRLVIWLGMMALHAGIMLVVDFADLTLGMVMIHLFTFDPDWLPQRKPVGQTFLLFDGACALCNGTVRFFLNEDHARVLQFAPLQGPTASNILQRNGIFSDQLRSLILVERAGTSDEKVHVKSNAVLRAFLLLGGFWQVVSWLRVAPRWLRDAVYDWIAGNRYRWFGSTNTSCALPAAGLRERLLA